MQAVLTTGLTWLSRQIVIYTLDKICMAYRVLSSKFEEKSESFNRCLFLPEMFS